MLGMYDFAVTSHEEGFETDPVLSDLEGSVFSAGLIITNQMVTLTTGSFYDAKK